MLDRGAMAERVRRELQREQARLQEALQEQEAECEALQRTCEMLEGQISQRRRKTAHQGAQTDGAGMRGCAQQTEAVGTLGCAQQTEAVGTLGRAQQTEAAGTRSCAHQTEATETRGCDQQTDPPEAEAGADSAVEDIEGLHESLDRAEELAVEMQREAQTLLREKTRVLGELRDARGENSRLMERVALLEGWKQSGELERDRLDLSVRSLEIENEDLRGQLGDWEAAAGGAAAEVPPPSAPLGHAALSPLSPATAIGGGRASNFAGRTPLTVRKMASLKDDKENTLRRAGQPGPAEKVGGDVVDGVRRGLPAANEKNRRRRPPLGDLGNTPNRGLAGVCSAGKAKTLPDGLPAAGETPRTVLSFTGLAEQVKREFSESPPPTKALTEACPRPGTFSNPLSQRGEAVKAAAGAALTGLFLVFLGARFHGLHAGAAFEAVLPAT